MESRFVVTSADAFDASIYEMGIKSSSQCFSTSDYRSFLIQECSPLRLRITLRTLVCNQAQQWLLALFHHGKYASQGILLRDSDCVETAAETIYQLIHDLVGKRVVYLATGQARIYP